MLLVAAVAVADTAAVAQVAAVLVDQLRATENEVVVSAQQAVAEPVALWVDFRGPGRPPPQRQEAIGCMMQPTTRNAAPTDSEQGHPSPKSPEKH